MNLPEPNGSDPAGGALLLLLFALGAYLLTEWRQRRQP